MNTLHAALLAVFLQFMTGVAGGQTQPSKDRPLAALAEIHHGIKRSETDNTIIELHIGGVFPPYVSDKHIEVALGIKDLRVLSLGPAGSDSIAPETFRKLRKLPHLEKMVFSEHCIDDQQMQAICSIQNLKQLLLWETDCSDEGFTRIGNLKKLEVLDLGALFSESLTGGCLENIGKLRALKVLRTTFAQNQIDGRDLRHLSGLVNLEELVFFNFTPQNDDLKSLAKLSKLRKLRLDGSQLTDDGLKHLNRATDLRDLLIPGATIKGPSLDQFTKLRNLDLSGSKVNDSIVSHLVELEHLETLNLRGTEISETGFSKLRSELPDCKIYGR